MAVPDYSLGMVQPSQVGQSFSQGLQNGVALGEAAQQSQDRARLIAAQDAAAKLAAQKAAEEAAARAQQQADFIDLVGKGLDKDASLMFAAKHPGAIEQLTKAHKLKSEVEQKQYIGQAQTLLAAGATDPKRASTIAKGYADAARNTPGLKDQAEALDKLSEQLLQSTDTATATLSLFLAGAMEPKDFADTVQKVSQAQALAKKAGADAEKAGVEARFAEDKIKADIQYTRDQSTRLGAMTRIEAGRLGVDRKRLELDTLKELNDANVRMGELPAAAQKQVSDAALDAAAGKTKIEQVSTLANEFKSLGDVMGGAAARAGSYVRDVAGLPDNESQARQKYQGLIDSLISAQYKGLGTMSDSDRKSARASFPDPYGATGPIVEFLEKNAEATQRTVRLKQAEVDYISQNRGLAPARQPLVVAGVQVQPGETFDKVVDRIEADAKTAKSQAAAAAAAPDADALRNKYKKAP